MNKCRDGRRASGGDSFCSWHPGPYAPNTNSTQSYLCLAHFQQHRTRSQSVVRREIILGGDISVSAGAFGAYST